MATDPDLYPCPSVSLLRKAFVGKRLHDVPAPAAVLDKAIVERNCKQMLTACGALKVDFRPHTKTHKVLSPFSIFNLEREKYLHGKASASASAMAYLLLITQHCVINFVMFGLKEQF